MSSLTRPINAQLEITDKCNFRCRHCYHLDFDARRDTQDEPDERIMQMAEQLARSEIFSVVLTGGEPLVRPRLVRWLVRFFKERNVDVSLNTNLLLLDPETLDDFMACRLDGMLISCPSVDPGLYGFMTGGGSFARFRERLKLLVERKHHFAVNMVVNRHNHNRIRETAVWMRDFGVEIFGATPMGLNLQYPDLEHLLNREQVRSLAEELVWIKDQLGLEVDIFEAIPKCAFPAWMRTRELPFMNRKCQAGKTIVSVSNRGDVRPCSHNPDTYGNLLEEPIETIWRRMEVWRDRQTIPNRCHGCKLVSNCYGGCRITAHAFTGDCQGEDPWMAAPVATLERLSHERKCLELRPEMVLACSKLFRWRRERDDDYLISSTRSNRNMTMVNQKLFEFVRRLRELAPLTLGDLAHVVGCSLDECEFQRVITLLTARDFVTLTEGKEVENHGRAAA